MSPLAGTKKLSSGTVSDDDNRSQCGGGGALPPSVVTGGFLPVDVTDAPTLSVEGPQSVPSRISVVRVDGTIAGDTPGRECPREERDGRPRAGMTRPAGVSAGGGSAGSLRGGRYPPWMLLEVSFRVCLLGIPPPPRGCCEPYCPR